MVSRKFFRKKICMLLASIQIVQLLSSGISVAAAETANLIGDINKDGIVDNSDLTILSGHVAKIAPIEDETALHAGDLNADGIISAADMTALSSMLEASVFAVTDVSVNQAVGEAGSIFEWAVETRGSTGTVEYAFQLVACSDPLSQEYELVVAEQDYSTSSEFHASIMDVGTYALNVSCRDEAGKICSASAQAPVTVIAPELQITNITSTTNGTVFVGDDLSWTVHTVGGKSPYQYQYALQCNDTQIHNADSSSSTYSVIAESPGTYLLKVSCMDYEGNTVLAYSDTVSVYLPPEEPEAPPVIRTINETYHLAQTKEEAKDIPAQELRFCWEAVDHAQSYELILESLNGDAWSEVLSTHVSETTFTISPDVLAGWNERTLFRLRATAQSHTTTEENILYFYSHTIPEPVLIDNQDSVKWNISNAEETAKTFSVSATSPWTVSVDVSWISLTKEETGFLAKVSKNLNSERSGIITVSDSTSKAYVVVKQGIGNGAPTLYYPAYSENPDSPTSIPVGGMILGFDPLKSNYVGVTLYEKSASGQLTKVYNSISPETEKYVQVVSDYDFKANTNYVIELAGYYSNIPENDVAKNYYYVRMTDLPSRILISGAPVCTIDSYTSFSVDLYSSGAWTYSTDADWLYPEAHTEVSYDKDMQSVDIILTPNETTSTRVGTIEFKCGNATATLTVTQGSCLPRIITPSNMSMDQNSPTILPTKGYINRSVYESCTYAYFENNAWSEENVLAQNNEPWESTTLYPDNYFKADVLYRFTLHVGSLTTVYYAKFSDSVTKPFAVARLGAEDSTNLPLSFTSGECQETIKLSTSGAWSISSSDAWLSVSATSGASAVSKKSLTISASKNTTGNPRTGTLTIRSQNTVCATIRVSQAAEDFLIIYVQDDDNDYLIYNPDTSFKNLDGSKNTVYFKVQAPLRHTVSSPDSWITCKKNNIKLENNTTGKRRTGTVVISCGDASESITITQEAQMALPTLISPALSTNYSSPSVLENKDLLLKFNAVNEAVRYHIKVVPADLSLTLPGSKLLSYKTDITANGSSAYSCTIPGNALSVNADGTDDIGITAYDRYGYSVGETFYVKTTSTGRALVNGTITPIWNNATDAAVSKDFTVRSTGTWNAVSKASWISLSKTSGLDNDVLTLSLEANTGAARTGQVAITVGTSETTLTVNQCAFLPEYPSITAPAFSTDSSSPTIIGADTTSIHVTWDYEPQAEYYKVSLMSFKSNSVQHTEASSPKLNSGEYTFENLVLEPGQKYWIKICRESHLGYTSKSYYFTLDDKNAYVHIDGETSMDAEMAGNEDFDAFTITSNGVWSAIASENWIMVDNERIRQSDLDLEDSTPQDYSQYSGLNGEDLYISVLSNPTDGYRYGTVTIRCGSAESKIAVTQEPHYRIAEIYSPQLANIRKEPSILPFGAVNLRWSEATGGTGKYSITLYERDDDKEYRYYEIFERKGIQGTQYRLTKDVLTEGKYYKLWMGTEINGSDETSGQWYYFRMGYENELIPSVSANWNAVGQEGFVRVNASASGGAGGYLFSYELLRNGQQVSITELDDVDWHTFNINETGTYQVRVYVRDSGDMRANALSSSYTIGAADLAQLKLSKSQWELPASGGSTSITIDSHSTWKLTSKPEWVTCSAMEGTSGSAITLTVPASTTGERLGYVIFSGSGKTVTLSIRQDGTSLGTPTVNFPSTNASVPLQDLSVNWNTVSDAGYYIFRLRDLTTDTLLVYDTGVEATSATISAGYLVNGHSYRIAVGAAHSDDSPTSSSISWAEREFQISATSDEMTSITGIVTSAEGNPLSNATITLSYMNSNGREAKILQVLTDANGQWEASGISRNQTYNCAVSLAGYTFDPAEQQVTASASTVSGVDFSAQNSLYAEVPTFDTETSYVEFAAVGGKDEIYINAPAGWTAEVDSDWLTLSAYSGSSSGAVLITAANNPENETRYGTVTIQETTRTRSASQYTVLDVSQDAKAKSIQAVGTGTTPTSIFSDAVLASAYNGITLLNRMAYISKKNLVINQDMHIPASSRVEVEGDIYINATVSLDASALLVAHGSIYVMTSGALDLSRNGNIVAEKDFVFQSGIHHSSYLTNGSIHVGGNVTLLRNFCASGGNTLHLTGKTDSHEIHVSKQFIRPQYLNDVVLDNQSIDAINISKTFACNGKFRLGSSQLLQGVQQTASAYSIKPSAQYDKAFRNDPRRNEILANVHVGLLRILAANGVISSNSIACRHVSAYSYLDDAGRVRSYNVSVDYHGNPSDSVSAGTVEYTESYGSGPQTRYTFYVSGDTASLARSVSEFKQALNSGSADAFGDLTAGYANVYRDALQSIIAGYFDDGTYLAQTDAAALLDTLCQNNDQLQQYYSAIRVLDQIQPDNEDYGQPTLELRLNEQSVINGYEHSASYLSGDTVYLEVRPSNADHLYRSWEGDPTQNKVWSSREIVNGDWTSIAVTIPEDLITGKYKIQVEASNSSVYNNPSAQKAVVSITINVTGKKPILVDYNVKVVDGGYVYKDPKKPNGESADRSVLIEPYYYLDPSRDIAQTADPEILKLIIDQFDVLNSHNSSASRFLENTAYSAKYGKGFYFPVPPSYCTTYARDVANAYGACFPMSICKKCGLVKENSEKDAKEMGEPVLNFLRNNGLVCPTGCGGSQSSLKAFRTRTDSLQFRDWKHDPWYFMKEHGSKYGWMRIPSDQEDRVEQAMEWANKGYLVLGLYSEYQVAGHAFVVYPTSSTTMHQAQAGDYGVLTDGSKHWNVDNYNPKTDKAARRAPTKRIDYFVYVGLPNSN